MPSLPPELVQAFIQWGFPSFFMTLVILVTRPLVRDHLSTNRLMATASAATAAALQAATAQLVAIAARLDEAANEASEDHAGIHETVKATYENTHEILRRIPAADPARKE